MQDKVNGSRWATDEEAITSRDIKVVKPGTEISAAGIPVGSNGKNILVDSSSMHTLVIGSTGSGKTQSISLPAINSMIENSESMVILDPKGEIHKLMRNKLDENNYKTIVIDFNEPHLGNHFNPLKLVEDYYNNNEKGKALDLLNDISRNLICDPKNTNSDPFWENSASDYFKGLVLSVLENNIIDKLTIKNIFDLSTRISESNSSTTIFKNSIKENSKAATLLNGILNAPTETRKSIISVFEDRIRRFILEDSIVEMMSTTDFEISELYSNKTCIFIMNSKNILNILYSLTITEIYTALINLNNKDNIKYNFILDEFNSLAPIYSFSTVLTEARGKNIRFTLLVTSIEDLYNSYGKEQGTIIFGNCGLLLYLLSNRIETLEEISKLCGNVYEANGDRPLITIEELQRMNQWEVIVIKQRCYPYKGKLIPNYMLEWNSENYSELKEHIKVDNNTDLYESITKSVKPIDVDDLVKRIDARIEELENEEQKEVIARDLKDINLKELSDRKIVIEKTTITIFPKE